MNFVHLQTILSRRHSGKRKFSQNKGFPTVKGFTVGCVPSTTVVVCFWGVSNPLGADPPGSRHPPEQALPPEQAPSCCKACWDSTPPCCKACWDTTPAPLPPVNRMTETCKNITFAIWLRTVITVYSVTRIHK